MPKTRFFSTDDSVDENERVLAVLLIMLNISNL